MCNCGKKSVETVTYYPQIQSFAEINANCDTTVGDLININTKLDCIKNYVSLRVYNSYKSYILSMLHTQRVCDYNIQEILNDIDKYGC